MNAPDGPVYGLPLDTPLDREPDARMVEAAEMWRIALAYVGVIGGWDRRISGWLLGKDAGTLASVASLLHRARQSGVEAGRREVLDVAGGRDLGALADDIRATCDHADRILTDGESGAQEVLEALLDGLRRTVDQHVTDPEHLAQVAARARRRYFSVLAGDLSFAQRQTALTIAVDTARTDLLGDSDLAAAVRAVVDADRQLDDAIGDLGLDGDDLPGDPVRSVVLPAGDAGQLTDFLEVPEEGHRVQWTHRADGLVDVRLAPADYTNLQSADAETGPCIAEDGHLVVEGRQYEVTPGWPRRPDDNDALVDAARGYCTGCVGEPGGPDDHDPAECGYGAEGTEGQDDDECEVCGATPAQLCRVDEATAVLCVGCALDVDAEAADAPRDGGAS